MGSNTVPNPLLTQPCGATVPDCNTNELSTKGVLGRLVGDRVSNVRFEAALHKNCPVEALERAAGDKRWELRRAAAWHPNCPGAVLEQLAGDIHSEVRAAAAGNVSCPPRPAM